MEVSALVVASGGPAGEERVEQWRENVPGSHGEDIVRRGGGVREERAPGGPGPLSAAGGALLGADEPAEEGVEQCQRLHSSRQVRFCK